MYFKKLGFPILWQILFIISCLVCSEKYFIYTNFIFYLGIIIYFYKSGDFSFSELKENLKKGKTFWLSVVITAVGMVAAFLLSFSLKGIFPNVDDGMIGLTRNNLFQLILFAISTIIFPPIAEEVFYRKAIIKFDTKGILIFTSSVGMILYALEHSLSWLGILETIIIAVPLTISYIKTKNVYIPMTAHFLVNLIGNGTTVILVTIKLLGL